MTTRQIARLLSQQPTITEQLYALFDQFGLGCLCVGMARDVAEAFGLNRTSAEISFYRWQALRLAA